MIKKKERQVYQQLVARLHEPEEAMSREALDGFFHALALTPRPVMTVEWLTHLFGGELPALPDAEESEESLAVMVRIYRRYLKSWRAGRLRFPHRVEELDDKLFHRLVDWTSGFCFGLLLAPEAWFPREEEPPEIADEGINSPLAAFSLMQALLFPGEFARSEEFQAMCGEEEPRQVMNEIMAFAVENLPAIVELFHRYAAEQGERAGAGGRPRLRLVGDDDGPGPAKNGDRAGGKGGKGGARVVALDDFRSPGK